MDKKGGSRSPKKVAFPEEHNSAKSGIKIAQNIQTALENPVAGGDINAPITQKIENNPNKVAENIGVLAQSGSNVTIQNLNVASSTPQLDANPFAPPSVRDSGLFGRVDDLKRLHELLQGGKNVCVVTGMGGAGKTELVRDYAGSAECRELFAGGVFYVVVRDRQNLAAEIVTLTEWRFKSPLPKNLTLKQQVKACWDVWKRQNVKSLLILDDVSKLAENVKPYLPTSDLTSLRLLMTSRESPDSAIQKLELQELLPDPAREFLASIIGAARVEQESEQADLLCEDLGYLPLALELVGYYLIDDDNTELSLAAMRGKLQEKVNHASLSPEDMPMGIAAERGVMAAFDLSWEELKTEAQYLACVLGAFASAPIDWSHVEGIYVKSQGEAFNPDNLKERWLKSLLKLHLVKKTESGIFVLHSLLRDYFTSQLNKHSDRSQILSSFIAVFVDVAKIIELYTTLAIFKRLEPQLKQIISLQNNKEDPQLAICLNGLAGLYQSQGKYGEAEPLFVHALLIREKRLGAYHPNVATSLNNLGLLYESQGKYRDAELFYLRSIEIYTRQFGVDHLTIADSFNNLAELYHTQGRYNEAQPLFVKSLLIYEKELGADHLNVAIVLNNLALLYQTQKKYSKAEPLFVKSLSIRKLRLGVDNLLVATSLNNLALLYKDQGKYNEAEPLFVQLLEILRGQLGEKHPTFANSLNNLASLYDLQKKYSESEPLYVRSLEIKKLTYQGDHPEIAISMNNLALCYRFQGNYGKAEQFYVGAIQILEQTFGSNHPSTIQVSENYRLLRNAMYESS